MGAYDCDCINNLEYEWRERKAQLSKKDTTKDTTSDLISRAAAQTEVMMKCERYTLARESHGMGHVEWSSDLISVGDAMDAIRDLPPAQPELQWIPVSERLPETNRDVLLQFSTSMGVGFWEHNSWGVNTGDNIYSEIGEGEAQPIAWMPLPEAYNPNK